MTIPMDNSDVRTSVVILDNYYNEEDLSPKSLYHRFFKDRKDAEKFISSVIEEPRKKLQELGLELTDDQGYHLNDIHIILSEGGSIVIDKVASLWKW